MCIVYCRAKFDDEITKELKHTGAGVLSMVNICSDCSMVDGFMCFEVGA